MILNKKYVLIGLSTILILFSCTKEDDEIINVPTPGKGGHAAITGHVKHHDDAIPNAMVYIKYGTLDLPGTSPGDYDDSTKASASDAHYSFDQLQKGNYYVFGIGYDSTCTCVVFGGVSVIISSSTEQVETNVPVTE